jgi:hypothetical protein
MRTIAENCGVSPRVAELAETASLIAWRPRWRAYIVRNGATMATSSDRVVIPLEADMRAKLHERATALGRDDGNVCGCQGLGGPTALATGVSEAPKGVLTPACSFPLPKSENRHVQEASRNP